MQQQNRRTIHIYVEEADEQPLIDADSPSPEQTQYRILGLCCGLFLCVVCVALPILATFLPSIASTPYDTTITRTLTLTLSEHPTTGQVQVFSLPHITHTEQLTVPATGSLHQNATYATGLITFFNGLFTPQTIPAGTTLTGRDGISVITLQHVTVPPATPTTPPTEGTVSVTAYSTVSGTFGNIPSLDINHVCCGSAILAQNLYAFSGGQDARDIPVLTNSDLITGSQQVRTQVTRIVNDQAKEEIQPGYSVLPLDCKTDLSTNHQPGDQAASALLTLVKICTPLAYFTEDIAAIAKQHMQIPNGYHLVLFSAFVSQSKVNATGGTVTVQAIAYLKQNTRTINTYHFAGK